jgi:peptidoglycan/LPS O-acetylase OafA/YrhL
MAPARDDDRLAALDGLRGLAALVVLLCHVVEASVAAIAATLLVGGNASGVAGWFTGTPLAIVWAGQQFVLVFFVLSGFVLTRGLRARPTGAAAFLAGRTVRLYLPAWLSLVPAAALLLLVSRAPAGGGGVGFWLDGYARPIGPAQIAHDLALVLPDRMDVNGGGLNRPLWSLRWEVIFSLALPLLLTVQTVLRRWALPLAALALAAVQVGHAHPALVFLAPFVLGMLMALKEDRIAGWRTRLAHRRALPAVVLAGCLLTADRWLPESSSRTLLVTAGAALAVLVPLVYGSVERVLCTGPMQWLGSRSFSLYLVHFPIVLALAFGLGRPGLPLLAATAIPASMLAAELFYRFAERPCHRLARAAGQDVAARRQRTTGAAPPRAAPVKA